MVKVLSPARPATSPSRRRSRSRIAAAAIALAAAGLALAGCASPGGGDTTGDGELKTVRVGVIPVVDIAPLYLGIREGYFAKEGLQIETVPAQNGAAIVPSVVSGDVTIGWVNPATILTAADKGLPLEIVAAGSYSTGTPGKDTAATVTMPGRSISSVADLAGRTVGTSSLGGQFTLTLRHLAEKSGIDPASIRFVELPSPDTPAALAKGDVDAAILSEPFLSRVLDDGAQAIAWNYADTYPDYMPAMYFTTKQVIAQQPELVARFKAAITKSLEYASTHPEEVRAILSEFTELDDAVRARVVLPRFDPAVNAKTLEIVDQMLVHEGIVKSDLDYTTVLPSS